MRAKVAEFPPLVLSTKRHAIELPLVVAEFIFFELQNFPVKS